MGTVDTVDRDGVAEQAAPGTEAHDGSDRRRSYLKDYYRENREAMRAARAKRYREDAEYRKRVTAAAVASRQRRQREQRQAQLAAGQVPSPVKSRLSGETSYAVEVPGQGEQVGYTGRSAAAVAGLTRTTWDRLVARGWVPPTPWRSPRGKPLYLELQVAAIAAVYAEYTGTWGVRARIVGVRARWFCERLAAQWQALGYPV